MSMYLYNSEEKSNHHVLGKSYNVEYLLGNGKIGTFSNILENIDGKYFWFCSEEDGLDVILQDRILTMTCNSRGVRSK